jgi:trimeric autotransporter adhesin
MGVLLSSDSGKRNPLRGASLSMIPLIRMMLVYLLFIALSSNCLAQIKNNVAGSPQCLPVNGELATTQSINAEHIALDGAGGFYVNSANTIYHMTKDGRLYWVAGFGSDSVDSGKAASAQFFYPQGLAVDTASNLFIADTWNNRIRKVTPAGEIMTVVGSGYRGYGGDGSQATSGLLNYKRSAAGAPIDSAQFKDFLLSVQTRLNHPKGVAVDSAGNIYIADSLNSRIRRVDSDGVITTIAGNGYHGYGPEGRSATSAQIGQPYGVSIDSALNLYIATNNYRICKVTPAEVITTVACNGTKGYSGDGSPANSAQLNDATDVAADSAGNLYIADTNNNRIRKITPAGVIITVAGNGTSGYSGDNGPALSAQLHDPKGVAVDKAVNLFIMDTDNYRIRKVAPDGMITTLLGNMKFVYDNNGRQKLLDTDLDSIEPTSMAIDSSANLYILDQAYR